MASLVPPTSSMHKETISASCILPELMGQMRGYASELVLLSTDRSRDEVIEFVASYDLLIRTNCDE